MKQGLAPYLFLLPTLLVFLTFTIVPALYNFYLSLFRISPLRPREFVGLGNFGYLVERDDLFRRALANTVLFVGGDVGLILVLSLAIALLLNGKIRFRGFFRSVFFYPVLLSPVVVALIWGWFLNSHFGILNAALRALGLEPQPWLLRADYAMVWVIVVHVWATIGFYSLILLAGLQSIPPDLHEAAAVDGSTGWQAFRYVTFPLLMPMVLLVLILATIRAFEVFDHVFVLTGGGPGFATLFVVQYIYRAGFELTEWGLASAASLMLFVVILSLTALQYVMGRLREAV
jgi:alpha-1,4-digalacturonate transport system permease protein